MAIASRRRTEALYAGQRAAALRKAEDILRPVVAPVPISLRTITPETLATFDAEWRGHPERLYPWPWRDMAGDYRRNEPSRFEVAVWSGEVLCGLAFGKLRLGYCGADYIEGSPVPAHPLRGSVLSAVLTALTAYAVALGRPEIRLIDPLPALVPRYKALGFMLATPRGQSRYCRKEVL
jgi:hypothetical protein